MIITLPDMIIEVATHKGKRYFRESDIEAWLLECAKTAKSHGLVQTEEFVNGLVQCMLRAK